MVHMKQGYSCAIAVLGSLNYDFVVRGPRLPARGETVMGDRFSMQCGGKGANQACQAALLGARVTMIGCVGRDFMGDEQLKSLGGAGAELAHIYRHPELPTGACAIHVDSRGDNTIMVAVGANDAVTPAMVEAARGEIESADVFVTQLEIGEAAIIRGLEIASAAGRFVILDPAPMRPVPGSVWGMIDLVKPNEIEAAYYTGIEREGRSLIEWAALMATKLRAMGPRHAVITLGGAGAWYDGPEGAFLVPGFAVDAVDTTGAGDSFSGALAVAIAEGMPMRDAIRFANAAGAVTAMRDGAQVSMRGREHVEALLHR